MRCYQFEIAGLVFKSLKEAQDCLNEILKSGGADDPITDQKQTDLLHEFLIGRPKK